MMCVWIIAALFLDSPVVFGEESSSCVINREEREGICKLISDCSYAIDLLRKNIFPQTCGFIGKNPLVCCLINVPTENVANDVQSRPTLSLVNLSVAPKQNYGELSKNKCLSYYPKPIRPILVAGGKPSLVKEFPHMAIIGYGDKDNIQWECGGSLISKKFVLTAAHCLTSKIGEAQYVRLGDLDLSTEEDDAEPADFTIVRGIPHPSYKPPVRYHDIALIELDREVALSIYVSPACLHTERELNVTTMVASGWGNTVFTGNSSSFLLKVDLDYVLHDQCAKDFGRISKTYLPNGIVDDSQICAGGVIGQDTCQGDSGGPLQVKNNERSFTVSVNNIIGITSFGKTCGLSKAPGVYTRVSHYIPWIESIAWVNEKEYGFIPLNK